MDVDVAISGGSVEGICAAVGFLRAVTVDLRHRIVAAAGNSAGGLILCLLASGRSLDWVEQTILATDFSTFVSKPPLWQVWKLVSIWRNGWLSDGVALERFLQNATENRVMAVSTFDLHVVGSNFTTGDKTVFSQSDTPLMPLWKAARITSCLPVGFKPVLHEGHIYYDGGVRRHYPIDVLPKADRPILGYLVGHKHAFYRARNNPPSLTPGLLGSLADYIDNSTDANVHDAIRRSREELRRYDVTVAYDDAEVGTFDFNMTVEQKRRVMETARTNTIRAVQAAEPL